MSHSKPFKSDDVRHMEALHAELELKALEAQELMGDPTWRRVLRGLLANRASLAGTIILIFFAALATTCAARRHYAHLSMRTVLFAALPQRATRPRRTA